jgi:hypothetical protein
MRHVTKGLIAAMLFAAACGRDDAGSGTNADAAASDAAAGTQAGAEQDLADVTGYRLTMDKMDKYFAAQRNMAVKLKEMSPEDRARIEADGGDSNDGLDDIARRIEQHPVISGAVREAGLSPREYATLTMAFVQSAMAASVLQMRPNDDQDSLAREMKANMDNIRFFREHETELKRKQEALEQEMQRLGISEDSL